MSAKLFRRKADRVSVSIVYPLLQLTCETDDSSFRQAKELTVQLFVSLSSEEQLELLVKDNKKPVKPSNKSSAIASGSGTVKSRKVKTKLDSEVETEEADRVVSSGASRKFLAI
jgi:hypothetical protein